MVAVPKSRVDYRLSSKAVEALIQYHDKQAAVKAQESGKTPLLGSTDVVQVQIGLEVPPVHAQVKPMRLEIPRPFRGTIDDDTDVCLIVKEDAKPWVQEMIRKFPQHMGCIKKVLGLESLRTKHAQYQQRRALLAKYDMFLADDRILPMLTTALGKAFFQVKKQPVPICLTREQALPFAIEKALRSTYMTLPRGTCITIVAGRTDMDPQHLAENVGAVCAWAIDKVPRKWANVRSISVKTTSSMALPFYNSTPEELQELAKLAGLETVWKKTDPKDTKEPSDESKQRKRKNPGKSPLAKALKKQKQREGNDDTEPTKETRDTDEEVVEKKTDAATTKKAAVKVRKTPKEDSKATNVERLMKKSKREEKPRPKPFEKKPMASDDDKPVPKAKESSDTLTFIAAKKFKGSKSGMVFKAGDKGLGYYVDVKPLVDKKAVDALLRSVASRKKRDHGDGRSRSSSAKSKHRGRR